MVRRSKRERSKLLVTVTTDGDRVVVATPGEVRVRDRRALSTSAAARGFADAALTMGGIQSVSVLQERGLAELRFRKEASVVDILRGVSAALRNRASISLAGLTDPAERRPTIVGRLVGTTLAAGSFGLAIIGAVVPGIPTVPFLLLTSYFLVRSSPALNRRLLRSPLFGRMLRDWQQHRAVRPQVKLTMLATVVVLVAITLPLSGLPPAMQIGVLFAAGIGVWSIWRLPTTPPEQLPRDSRGVTAVAVS